VAGRRPSWVLGRRPVLVLGRWWPGARVVGRRRGRDWYSRVGYRRTGCSRGAAPLVW